MQHEYTINGTRAAYMRVLGDLTVRTFNRVKMFNVIPSDTM